MQQIFRSIFLTGLIFLFQGGSFLSGQSHPRGLVTVQDLDKIRDRIQKPAYADFLQKLHYQSATAPEKPGRRTSPYDLAQYAIGSATLYLLTEEADWADRAYTYAKALTQDSLFRAPFSFGLTRAAIVRALAISYDFCYQGWSPKQRKRINAALLTGLSQVHASMGHSANYNMASNWMGVRYGAVILAAAVYDHADERERNPALAYRWDAEKRLFDHLDAVFYRNGWHGESMGYFGYDLSFFGLGIIALQNGQHGQHGQHFQLSGWVPKMTNSFWGLSTATVDIASYKGRRGLKADFSDDNIGAWGPGAVAMSMRLAPPAQIPALRAIFEYRNQAEPISDNLDLMLRLLYYDDSIPLTSPTKAGWQTYHDPEQGIVMMRNRFQDSMDIVFSLSATSRRVRGHQGPDTHTWRLIGLGVPWVVGGGRTGLTTVQTNFFPDSSQTPLKSTKATGTLQGFEATDMGGWIKSSGSCLGLEDHQRHTALSYAPETGCAAAILMRESASAGHRWRLQAPDFLKLEVADDGYLLTAPNGASMRVQVLKHNGSGDIRTGLHRYGGKTVRHNVGILWGGEQHETSRWIDIHCDGELTVLMTLQEVGKPHPPVAVMADGRVKVGEEILKED